MYPYTYASTTGNPVYDAYLSSLEDSFGPVVDFISNHYIAFLIIFVVLVLLALIMAVLTYIFYSIGLFKLSRSAGFGYSWFTFLPYLGECLIFKLPKNKFKFCGITTETRMKAFAYYLILRAGVPMVLSMISNFISVFFPVFYIVEIVFSLILSWVVAAYLAVAKYDLLKTFNTKKGTAVTISVLSIFCPLVFAVYLFAIRKCEPIYGYDYYYRIDPSEIDQDDEYSR